MPPPTVHTARSGVNCLSIFTSKHVSDKAGKETYIWKIVGVFWCAQGDNVRCMLCSIVQKGTLKWNIKWHYDTVLCSKSAIDTPNRSIFTLRHVHFRLCSATPLWGHIEYRIADCLLYINFYFIITMLKNCLYWMFRIFNMWTIFLDNALLYNCSAVCI